MKQAINNFFRLFGYEVRRTKPWPDIWMSQKDMIDNPAPVIFDVGAHIGSVAEEYRKVFPAATIHAFEPTPASFAELQKLAGKDPNLFAHQMAIGDQKGSMKLNKNVAPMTNSLLPADPRCTQAWGYLGEDIYNVVEQVEVETTSIDLFCEEQAIKQLDILKLDIQGYEYTALQGARRMLEKHAISLVYMEIIMASTYVGQHSLADYLTFFDALDYELLNFYSYLVHDWKLIQLDAVFVRKQKQAGG